MNRRTHSRGWVSSVAARRLALVAVALFSAVCQSRAVDVRQNGPSSRRTGLSISEIMYHPAPRGDGLDLEYVEILNADPVSREIGGYRISGDVDYTFPSNAVLAGESRLVVALNPQAIRQVYGLTDVYGPWSGNLPNGGGTVRLRDRQDAILLEVTYSDAAPWPVAADGAGHALVLMKPDYGERDPRAWAASAFIGGSPGYADTPPADDLSRVVINEILAHSDQPLMDFIELYNAGTQAVDIGGCGLSDKTNICCFTIPPSTVLQAGDFAVFDEAAMGFAFALSSQGEDVFFVDPTGTRILDAVRFGATENGANNVSTGRYPDGHPGFRVLGGLTPGGTNNRPRRAQVVINEIMYNPISDDGDDGYIELHNRGAAPVDVGGWRLNGGIAYTIPGGTTIPADGYLVIARNRARLLANHPLLDGGITLDDFAGQLSNRGEWIALTRPDDPNLPLQDFVIVDEVAYADGWGEGWSDGGGSSLELIDPHADGMLGPNWADSDETQKSAWTLVEATGVLDNGGGSINALEITLFGAGECLVDNVMVYTNGGANRISNPDFEGGMTGWSGQGNHEDTVLETGEGDGSAQSLRIRTTGRGDWGANLVKATLTSALSAGQVVTIRARVRWLKGDPEVLFRLQGNWLEAAGRSLTATDLGSPGLPNTRLVTNAGPAILDVRHEPAVPAADQDVTVFARVDDPDGIDAVTLKYRIDPSSNLVSVTMTNNGRGMFVGTIPGQSSNVLAAFRVEASDRALPAMTSIFPADAPARECLVRWGDPEQTGVYGKYRFWMTEATLSTWTNRLKYSNKSLDCTFVLDNHRVIYNIGGKDSGNRSSKSPVGTDTCDYSLTFPNADRLLGAEEITLNAPGNGPGGDWTYQREQTAYWIGEQMGLPACRRRHVIVFVNGVRRGVLMEDAEQPGAEMVDSYWPEGGRGDLHKVISGASLSPRRATTGGVLKLAPYRQTFAKRAVQGSKHNYTNLLQFVEMVNTPMTNETYRRRLEAVMDVDQWLRTYAVEHAVGLKDSFGVGSSQNLYLYRPVDATWKAMLWDVDFGLSGYWLTMSMFNGISRSTGIDLSIPAFSRAYWRAIYDLAYGPLRPDRIEPLMDANYNAMIAAGLSVEYPSKVKEECSIRVAFLLRSLAAVAAPFAITSNGGADFSTTERLVWLEGVAPVEVEVIALGGAAYPVEYTTITNWRMRVALEPGPNTLALQGLLHGGSVHSNASDAIVVTWTGTAAPSPLEQLVINEIMYAPAAAAASYIEIHNRSATETFDLGGMRLQGLNFVFEPGTLLGPTGYGVVAASLPGYAAAYTNAEVVLGVYPGTLDSGGEWLRLWRPDGAGGETLVDEVYYDDDPPWPTLANDGGCSLQLIDVVRDNNRVGNWAADPVKRFTPGAANSVTASLSAFPQVWINEVMPSNTTSIADNMGEREPWLELYNAEGAAIDLGSGFRLSVDATNLAGWSFPSRTVAAGGFQLVWMDDEEGETTVTNLHAGLRLSSPGLVVLVWNDGSRDLVLDYLAWDGTVPARRSLGRYPEGARYTEEIFHNQTPGATNDPSPPPVTVAINEWMASNTKTVSDPADVKQPAYEDWFELYNYGDEEMDLTDFTLTDKLSDPTKYRIPSGRTLGAGQYLLVWADEETSQNAVSNGHLHVNFALSKSGEALGLYAPDGTAISMVAFGRQRDDVSEGLYPNGVGARWEMTTPTPGASNVWFAEAKKIVTITPKAGQSKAPGTADPVFVFTNSEWGDNNNIGGAPGRVAGEAVGTYAYTLGNLSISGNYILAICANPATFEILTTDTILTVSAGSGGTVSPSGATVVLRGVATGITATAGNGHTFSSWTVTSGTAMIANTNVASTSVMIGAPATVWANFTPNAILPSGLPFSERFEPDTVALGVLHGQNNWAADVPDAALVQIDEVYEGLQALGMNARPGMGRVTVSHAFTTTADVIWIDLRQRVLGASVPQARPDAAATFSFNGSGRLVVCDGLRDMGDEWVTLSNHAPRARGDWVRLTVRADYSAKRWTLYLDEAAVAENLGFATSRERFSEIRVESHLGVMDDLTVGDFSPLAVHRFKGTVLMLF